MEIKKEFLNIMNANIALAHTVDEEKLTTILLATKNLLFILDANKSAEYKIAIIMEYLENIAPVLTTSKVNELRDYIGTIKLQSAQTKACQDIASILTGYFDPKQVDPQLVVFWLKRSCTAQVLKNMDTLMIFLTKDQQKQILAYDKNFLADPYLQKLTNCLSKL